MAMESCITMLLLGVVFSVHSISGALDSRKSSFYWKREAELPIYAPIRIKPVFYDLEIELENNEIKNLQTILNRAILYIKDTLKDVNLLDVPYIPTYQTTTSSELVMIPLTGPLLLKRSGCRSVWSRGRNKNKCSMVKHNYKGEKCLDFFNIPQKHLDGLAVWKENGSKPHKVLYPTGTGIQGADFVLYVQSLTTARCQLSTGQTIVAYSSYCQLGQNSRPVAGYINFCPDELKFLHSNQGKLFWTCLHELFHTFGFSKDLFHKFRDCTNPARCWMRNSLFRQIDGVQRLITPAVVRESKHHFHCMTQPEFGVPLQLSKDGRVMSHWDAKFMQGSIMAPHLDMPHLTSVDRMSLAVFEDSGWYRVNYSMADPYMWGKNGGCSFGLTTTCNKPNEFFCTGRSQGCHYLHLDKAECNTKHYLGDCHIFLVKSDGDCTNSSVGSDLDTGQVYSPQSRCFQSNLTLQNNTAELAGHCYEHRCKSEQELEVNIGDRWQLCPAGQTIRIFGYNGMVSCPDRPEFLCVNRLKKYKIPDGDDITASGDLSRVLKKDILLIHIFFDESDYSAVTVELGEIVVSDVLSLTNISRHQIRNIIVDDVTVSFELYIQSGNETSAFIFETLLKAVQNRSFVVVSPSGQILTAIEIRQSRKPRMESSDKNKSTAVPVALAIGFSILVPVTLVMSVVFIRKKLQCSGADERQLHRSSYEDIEINTEIK